MNRDEIQKYKFNNFMISENKSEDEIYDYEIKDLSKDVVGKKENVQKIIKLERVLAQKSDFKFSEIVQKHRGIKEQEKQEEQETIKVKVDERLSQVRGEAFNEGIQKGAREGQDKAYTEFKTKVDAFTEKLEQMILDVRNTEEKILSNQKKNVYELIRGMVKWVILRELKDDGKYLDRLLEKLIYELNTRSNIIVQVNEKTFETMDIVLESVQKKIGSLDNVRVEIIPELEDQAIVLETENGILDASLEEQFLSLDRIFDGLDVLNE